MITTAGLSGASLYKITRNGMVKGMRYRVYLCILLLVIIMATPLQIYAEAPYQGYIYNVWNQSVPSPNGYLAEAVISGEDLGVGRFNNPQDIFAAPDGNLYILDSGNSRIIMLDTHMKLKGVLDKFHSDNGEEKLNNPTGLFVTEQGIIYIADKDNGRVLVTDLQGNVIRKIGKPVSDMVPSTLDYKPHKVVVDKLGTTYVLAQGVYMGAFTFSSDDKFMGYYASNRLETTLRLVQDFFWKKILNSKQKQKMARYVPIEYSNFDIDSKNFVYTCTNSTENSWGEIKKINPKGVNILKERNFGDVESVWLDGKNVDTSFVDIVVDEDGFISGLDMTRGRIFNYDMEGNLLFVTGGLGQQVGTFKSPSAIESFNGNIIVLDSLKNNMTVFSRTDYGQKVMEATKLYFEGQYDQAVGLWTEVIKRNGNLELAYMGIGKALYNTGDYKEAMKYFKLGYDREGYSEAFKEHRKMAMRKSIGVIALVLILLFLLVWYLDRNKKTKSLYGINTKVSMVRYPFFVLFHPVQGYEDLKYNRKGSLTVSTVILALWFMVTIFDRQMTGFIFNYNRIDKLNILLIFVKTLVVFILWVTANWSLCTLLEGKGKLKDIWITSAYALVPMVIIPAIVTVLSNIITLEEGVFIRYATLIAQVWSAILLLSGMKTIHEYTLKKTVASIGLSAAGMGIIVFLCVLTFSLFQQLFAFASTIWNEVVFKI